MIAEKQVDGLEMTLLHSWRDLYCVSRSHKAVVSLHPFVVCLFFGSFLYTGVTAAAPPTMCGCALLSEVAGALAERADNCQIFYWPITFFNFAIFC